MQCRKERTERTRYSTVSKRSEIQLLQVTATELNQILYLTPRDRHGNRICTGCVDREERKVGKGKRGREGR